MRGGGGPASHIDQGRRSRFPARVLLRPGNTDRKQLIIVEQNTRLFTQPGTGKLQQVSLSPSRYQGVGCTKGG